MEWTNIAMIFHKVRVWAKTYEWNGPKEYSRNDSLEIKQSGFVEVAIFDDVWFSIKFLRNQVS